MQPNRAVHASRWHPQSSLAHEAGLAVAKVGGDEGFWKFSDAMFEYQEVQHFAHVALPRNLRHCFICVLCAGLL